MPTLTTDNGGDTGTVTTPVTPAPTTPTPVAAADPPTPVTSVTNVVTPTARPQFSVENERVRELQAQIEELQALVPQPGHVVIPEAEKDELVSYRGLGDIAVLRQTKEQLAQLLWQREINEVAAVAKVNGLVLAQLPSVRDLKFVIEGEGSSRTVSVQPAEEGAGKVSFDEYVQANWSVFLPALHSQMGGVTNVLPKQHLGGSPAGGTIVDAFLRTQAQAQAQRRNPLQT